MLAAIGSSGRTTGPPPITDEILPPSPMQSDSCSSVLAGSLLRAVVYRPMDVSAAGQHGQELPGRSSWDGHLLAQRHQLVLIVEVGFFHFAVGDARAWPGADGCARAVSAIVPVPPSTLTE